MGSHAGGSGAAHAVSLSLVAPTSGATVGVREIEVVGNVTPAGAAVTVGGQPAKVSGGAFKQTLRLSLPSTTIQVSASAPGLTPATASTTVHYSSTLAVALTVAHRAIWTPTRTHASGHSGIATASGAGVVALKAELAKAARSQEAATKPTADATHNSSPASTPQATTTQPSAPTTTQPSTPVAQAPASTPPATTPTSSSPTPTPSSSQPTAAEVKQEYLESCIRGDGGKSATAYCTCMYGHMHSTGALSTRADIQTLQRDLKRYNATHNPAALPVSIRNAIIACVSKLPDAPLPLSGLGHHSAVPPSPTGDGSPTTTTSSSGSSLTPTYEPSSR
ncbi:MAG: hypothetical protein WAK93_16035 [Solirubrobacteraceae bacterium]